MPAAVMAKICDCAQSFHGRSPFCFSKFWLHRSGSRVTHMDKARRGPNATTLSDLRAHRLKPRIHTELGVGVENDFGVGKDRRGQYC